MTFDTVCAPGRSKTDQTQLESNQCAEPRKTIVAAGIAAQIAGAMGEQKRADG